ncbi:MAG: hypothetical protein AB7G39_08930 [Alphaproteobacteria bacterium]
MEAGHVMVTLDYSNYLAGQRAWAQSLSAQAAKADTLHADELGRLAGDAFRRIAALAAVRVFDAR